jgi:Raf kinase inhibitor-like YbhB/YbcL family protein
VAEASTAKPAPATPTFPAATIAPVPFTLLSIAFPNAGAIPLRYTCDGEDISPALSWTSHPPGTAAFAIIMDDPDAPGGTWDHWVIFEIPAGSLELPEGRPATPRLPGGAIQGSNSWGETGYGGPCPPPGPAHVYRFFVYALDRSLDLPAGASKAAVLDAMAGHILAESLLAGSYGR